jgi:hypothetical protein
MISQHAVLAERASAFRRLHVGPRRLVLPNAWDVASARLVVKAGFPVVATSSGAVAASLGYEDTDSMPVDDAFGVVARIAQDVAAPVTADLEAGYGLPAGELVERLLNAGAVGATSKTPTIAAVAGSSTPMHRPSASAPSAGRPPTPASRSCSTRGSTSCASRGPDAPSSRRRSGAPRSVLSHAPKALEWLRVRAGLGFRAPAAPTTT